MDKDKIIKELRQNYNLLCAILKQSEDNAEYKADLSKLETIIRRQIPDTLKHYAPENFYELYLDFTAEYGRFKDFILYDQLIGKHTVALGGGFSSGKSSFLNTLMAKEHGKYKKTVLPEDIDPSTSIPTYIVNGKENKITGINVFDTKVEIESLSYIGKIAHGFGRIKLDGKEDLTDAVTLGHVLDNMFFSTPWQVYEHIAFLDTPGYSKPDMKTYAARTDEKIARGQLNASDYILWFVPADSGTITESDIQFIQTLRQDIPKLIIVSKADAKPVQDLKEIVAKVKKDLSGGGIRYEDVFVFSKSLYSQAWEWESAQKEFIERQMNEIERRLKIWNNQIYESNFARNFKSLFVTCGAFYRRQIEEEERRLARLNTSYTKLGAEDIREDTLEPLRILIKESQERFEALENVNVQIKQLQTEFFTELKRISDTVGIAMPEPDEIELLRDRAEDAWDFVGKCLGYPGRNTDFSDRIRAGLSGAAHALYEQPGSPAYGDRLLDMIRTNAANAGVYELFNGKQRYLNALKQAASHSGLAGIEKNRQYKKILKLYET